MTAPATIPPTAPSARPMASKPVATPSAVPTPIPTISHTPAKRSCKAFINLPSGQSPAAAAGRYLYDITKMWDGKGERRQTLDPGRTRRAQDLEDSPSGPSGPLVVKDTPAQPAAAP